MDILSDILRDMRLASAVLSVGEYRAPWGIDKGAIAGAPFHIVMEGRCLLTVGAGDPIELMPGDLVVFPHGSSHTLMSEPGVARVPFAEVLRTSGIDPAWSPGKRIERLDRVQFGGRGRLTRIVNGIFAFHDRRPNPLLAAFPDVMPVRGRLSGGRAWLDSSVSQLLDETERGDPGFQSIAERLADIIFIQAVRDYIGSTPAIDASWLRGLADPQIAQVLSLVHAKPDCSWTVASLAEAAGLSRTVLANRFRDLVGLSVMEYVTGRRMHVAAGLLSDSTEPLAKIANEVGYGSDISFSRAFRRWSGVPPGKYRRTGDDSLDIMK